MTLAQRIARSLAAACVVLPISFVGAVGAPRHAAETTNEFSQCDNEQTKQARATWQSALLRKKRDFMDAVKIGMTAAEVDAAELISFEGSWGKKINTTVTANGMIEQWVYRFSNSSAGGNDLYVYLRDGVVFAIQK